MNSKLIGRLLILLCHILYVPTTYIYLRGTLIKHNIMLESFYKKSTNKVFINY